MFRVIPVTCKQFKTSFIHDCPSIVYSCGMNQPQPLTKSVVNKPVNCTTEPMMVNCMSYWLEKPSVDLLWIDFHCQNDHFRG